MEAFSRTAPKGIAYHLCEDSFCTQLREGMAGPKKRTNPSCYSIFTFGDLLAPTENSTLF